MLNFPVRAEVPTGPSLHDVLPTPRPRRVERLPQTPKDQAERTWSTPPVPDTFPPSSLNGPAPQRERITDVRSFDGIDQAMGVGVRGVMRVASGNPNGDTYFSSSLGALIHLAVCGHLSENKSTLIGPDGGWSGQPSSLETGSWQDLAHDLRAPVVPAFRYSGFWVPEDWGMFPWQNK